MFCIPFRNYKTGFVQFRTGSKLAPLKDPNFLDSIVVLENRTKDLIYTAHTEKTKLVARLWLGVSVCLLSGSHPDSLACDGISYRTNCIDLSCLCSECFLCQCLLYSQFTELSILLKIKLK